jgi:hypothetical protein
MRVIWRRCRCMPLLDYNAILFFPYQDLFCLLPAARLTRFVPHVRCAHGRQRRMDDQVREADDRARAAMESKRAAEAEAVHLRTQLADLRRATGRY